jgi:hypothetical protein
MKRKLFSFFTGCTKSGTKDEKGTTRSVLEDLTAEDVLTEKLKKREAPDLPPQ